MAAVLCLELVGDGVFGWFCGTCLGDSSSECGCGANGGGNVSNAFGGTSSHFMALSAGVVECVVFSLERAEPVGGVGEDSSGFNSGSGLAVGEARCGWEV